MSEQLIFCFNLKNEEWSSLESFKENQEDLKKTAKLFLRTSSAVFGSKSFFFMEYANNKALETQENSDILESYELCSFDFTRFSLEFYNIPTQEEIFPLKRAHFLVFNQNGQLLIFDNEILHRYDFSRRELSKINKGVILSPLNSWSLLDFGLLDKSLYMLGREDDKIKLFFILETELNEMKLMEENISLHVLKLNNLIFKFC